MRPSLPSLLRRPRLLALALGAGLVALATASRDAACALPLICTPPVPGETRAGEAGPVEAAAAVEQGLATARPARRVADGAPERLADTGLYADAARTALAPGVQPYTPRYPLWSDGAAKRRWVRLPPGAPIDARDADAWEFPVGTQFWKEFAFEGRRVETRYLERALDGWIFATYAWPAAGTDGDGPADSDAQRVGPEGRPAAYRAPDGVPHDIPARNDCAACHEGRAVPVLGFSALQLSPERDPLAPHAEAPEPGAVTLDELNGRGALVPPAAAVTIAARSPRERAALGYLHANCGSCHTARPAATGPLAELGMILELTADAPAPAAQALPGALRTTLDVPARYRPVATGAPLPRIRPGDPAGSVLRLRAASRFAARQMPPLGTHRPDAAALALIDAWIREDLAAPAPSTPVR